MKHVKRILGPIVEAKPTIADPIEDIKPIEEEKAIEEKPKKGRKKKNV